MQELKLDDVIKCREMISMRASELEQIEQTVNQYAGTKQKYMGHNVGEMLDVLMIREIHKAIKSSHSVHTATLQLLDQFISTMKKLEKRNRKPDPDNVKRDAEIIRLYKDGKKPHVILAAIKKRWPDTTKNAVRNVIDRHKRALKLK